MIRKFGVINNQRFLNHVSWVGTTERWRKKKRKKKKEKEGVVGELASVETLSYYETLY